MFNQKLDFTFSDSLSLLFAIKIDVFPLFTGFNSHSGHFPWKQLLKINLHDFLTNSRDSCKKYCLHNCTLWGIATIVDPRIKFGLRKGDCFVKKMSFSRVFLRWSWIFFSPIGLVSFIDPLYQKVAKAWCWKLPKY